MNGYSEIKNEVENKVQFNEQKQNSNNNFQVPCLCQEHV